MKITIKLLLVIFLFVTCSNDETPQIIGKWKLIAFLDDPGDGSGTFHRVDSEQTIEFFHDGTLVINNSNWCGANGTEVSATYSIEQSIILVDCEDEDYVRQYHFNLQEFILILSYGCTEACKGMYIKIE